VILLVDNHDSFLPSTWHTYWAEVSGTEPVVVRPERSSDPPPIG